jgi:hypothetical protein
MTGGRMIVIDQEPGYKYIGKHLIRFTENGEKDDTWSYSSIE